MTAAEAHVLLKGVDFTGLDAFRLAIAELVARGRVTLGSTTVRKLLVLRKPMPLLSAVGRAPEDPVLRSVWDTIARAQRGGRPAPATDVADQVRQDLGDLDFWGRKVVAQALVDAGLLEVRKRSSWFGFRVPETPTPTAAGAEELRRLNERLDVLRATGRPLAERAQALAALGAAALLAREVWPELGRLREQRPFDATEGGSGGGARDPDLAGLDLGLLDGIDLPDFDSLGDAFDAIGDVVDSGGDGGDGNGGNGD